VPLKHPTGIFLDEAEPAILPGGAGPLDVPHRSAPDENFGAAAQQKDFDDRSGLEIDATLAQEAVCADVFRRSEQVETLAAGACADQLENYFEPNSMIAAAFRMRAVDRLFDRRLELVEVERLLKEVSRAEVEAEFAVFVGGLSRDDENRDRLRVADRREGLTKLETRKAQSGFEASARPRASVASPVSVTSKESLKRCRIRPRMLSSSSTTRIRGIPPLRQIRLHANYGQHISTL
jgi:hypothetical protein